MPERFRNFVSHRIGELECKNKPERLIAHARYTVFQMAEVAVPRDLFRRILEMIGSLRPREAARC